MPITISIQTRHPELTGPVLGVLKPSAAITKTDVADVMVGSISASALIKACTHAATQSAQLLLLEVTDTNPQTLAEQIKAASQLHTGATTYHGRYITVKSSMVGSLYGFKRTYVCWGTDNGMGCFADVPDARPLKRQTGRHTVGETEHKEALAGLAGLSGGDHEGYGEALRRWEHVTHSPMPLIGNEHGELNPRWLGWSMGHGNSPLPLGRRIGLRSIPQMAYYGWAMLKPGKAGTWESPTLF